MAGLRLALDAARASSDPAAAPLLRLNLRDARDQLARRLAEVAPAGSLGASPDVAAAHREAGLLLAELDAAGIL